MYCRGEKKRKKGRQQPFQCKNTIIRLGDTKKQFIPFIPAVFLFKLNKVTEGEKEGGSEGAREGKRCKQEHRLCKQGGMALKEHLLWRIPERFSLPTTVSKRSQKKEKKKDSLISSIKTVLDTFKL